MKDETRSKSFNQLWDDYQRERKRGAELLLKIERLEATIRLREKEIPVADMQKIVDANEKLVKRL